MIMSNSKGLETIRTSNKKKTIFDNNISRLKSELNFYGISEEKCNLLQHCGVKRVTLRYPKLPNLQTGLE